MGPTTRRVVYGKRQTRAAYIEFSSPIKAPSPAKPGLVVRDSLDSEDENEEKENKNVKILSANFKDLELREDEKVEAASIVSEACAPGTKKTSRALARIDANVSRVIALSDRDESNSALGGSPPAKADVSGEKTSNTTVPVPANTTSSDVLLAELPDSKHQPPEINQRTDDHKTQRLPIISLNATPESTPPVITSSTPSSTSSEPTISKPPLLTSLTQQPLPERPRRTTCKPAPTTATTILSTHAAPLLSLSNDPSPHPTPFATWATSLSAHFSITKIAEASYGEVYRLSLLRPHPRFTRADESVLKLIALKPPPPGPGAPAPSRAARARANAMSAVADVAGEVRLLRCMTPVPGFTNFRDVRVVQGRPPAPLVDAWRAFDRDVRRSEFPDPGKRASYPDTQLWAVVEMQDAGVDLETRVVRDVWEAWDAFWGIASALAKGEEYAEYEHRDLHLGNVCVRWPPPSTPGCAADGVTATAGPRSLKRKLGYTGLETTIIDYTLSRANMPDGAGPAFLDLARDASLFESDGSVEYQYDMYRHMRAAVLKDDPLAVCDEGDAVPGSGDGTVGSAWEAYRPITNLVWLHFVLHMLCRTVQWPSSGPRDAREDVAESAAGLEVKLRTLTEKLELKHLGPGERTWESAGMLVAWAVEQEWLDKEDIIGLSRQKRSGRRRADKKADKVVT